jgi:hypothetical protein
MEKREDRRDRTYRAASRHRRDHHRWCRVGPSFDHPDCFCKPIHFYDKTGCQTHHCRGRKHGQPKLGVGVCKGFDRRPGLLDRRAGRRELQRWHKYSDT